MKTILVPTDFSEKSEHAAEYAFRLAAFLGMDLLLFNSYFVPQAETTGIGMMPPFFVDYELFEKVSTEQLRKETEQLKDRMEKAGVTVPGVRYSNGIGSLGEGIRQMQEKEDISMIVMGSRSSEALMHFFYGSDTAEVVRRASCPVLMIPADASFRPLIRIAFASDVLDERVLKALNFVTGLAAPFDAEILVTHVSRLDTSAKEVSRLLEKFYAEVSAIPYEKIACTDVKGDDITKTLLSFTESGDFGLIALVHKRHTLYEKVFDESITKKVMGHHQIPYLVFPADF
jgi:nucleotide-binding universal stress UspA family protein